MDVNRNSSSLVPQNYFPLMDSKRKSRNNVATLLVPMFKRRGRAGMIRLGEPFPAKPMPSRPIYRNIIREALNIKDFLSENPQRTYTDAGQHFHLTRARISQLMKIVHELPAPFIERMRTCDDQVILRTFSGKTLLKIVDIMNEKERQNTINRLSKTTEPVRVTYKLNY